MEYVDELIQKTRQRFSNLEEGYLLDKEILEFLHDEKVPEEQKRKLRAEGLLEPVAMLVDGYKQQKKLEHYSTQKSKSL